MEIGFTIDIRDRFVFAQRWQKRWRIIFLLSKSVTISLLAASHGRPAHSLFFFFGFSLIVFLSNGTQLIFATMILV